MTNRNLIYVAHSGLYAPLARELRLIGLELTEDWQRCLDDSERMLGAFTWFYEGMRHPLDTLQLSRALRRRRIPLFAWNRDAPHYLNRATWRLNLLDRARLYDIYATHTLVDQRRQFAESTLYLPNAADVAKYQVDSSRLARLRERGQYRFDVSFFGAMNGTRYPELREREAFFSALGERLNAHKISFIFREAEGMDVTAQVKLIQESRINLNFGASCDYRAPVASGLPERCYGIPACGGFLLCDKRTHARDDFNPGLNWAEFDGLDDCVRQIHHWLDDFGSARDLAERCHEHIVSQHTYAHRAQTLRNALVEWHSGRRGRLA